MSLSGDALQGQRDRRQSHKETSPQRTRGTTCAGRREPTWQVWRLLPGPPGKRFSKTCDNGGREETVGTCGGWIVSLKGMWKSYTPAPVNVALSGDRALADVMGLR